MLKKNIYLTFLISLVFVCFFTQKHIFFPKKSLSNLIYRNTDVKCNFKKER